MYTKYWLFFLVFLFHISYGRDNLSNTNNKNIISFSCLSNFESLVVPADLVKIEPDNPTSPSYNIKNLKYYYGEFPDRCKLKNHNESKLLILMQDKKLLKIEMKFFNSKPKFIKEFNELDQVNIDKAFALNGSAFYFASIKINKLYDADYELSLKSDDYFEERFTIVTPAIYDYE